MSLSPQTDPKSTMMDIALGAHLTSPRKGFVHHGIYVGGRRVIHYGGYERSLRRSPVEIVTLDEFTRGRGLAIVDPVAPRYAGNACIERACSRLGEDRYRLWSNNCEHFTEWCISGASRSRQVEAYVETVRSLFDRLVRPVMRKPRSSRLRARISSQDATVGSA
jgi:Lecithin retinol acyltransferase